MDEYEVLLRLNKSLVESLVEGPSHNIWLPKFSSRKKIQEVIMEIQKAENQNKTDFISLCRCYIALAKNYLATEEEEEAWEYVIKAFDLFRSLFTDTPSSHNTNTLDDIEQELQGIRIFLEDVSYRVFLVEYIDICNILGILFASNFSKKYSLIDSINVLLKAREAYHMWHFSSDEEAYLLSLVPDILPSDSNKAISISGGLSDQKPDVLTPLLRMNESHTYTLCYLAQSYGAQGDKILCAKYTHLTLLHQLLTQQEFSPDTWTKNAMDLSIFYESMDEDGKALYCLKVAEYAMEKWNIKEGLYGSLTLSFGRFYSHRLKKYAPSRHDSQMRTLSPLSTENEKIDDWWKLFPLPVNSPMVFPEITTFEMARDTFKLAHGFLLSALEHYSIEEFCSINIGIVKDISNLFCYLEEYESDVNRKIAMLTRAVNLLEPLTKQLNKSVYLTSLRQIWFDLGELYALIIELREAQMKANSEEENSFGISNQRFNKLIAKGSYYFSLLKNSFTEPEKGMLKTSNAEELELIFKCLYQIAHLQALMHSDSFVLRCQTIEKSIKAFQECQNFYKLYSINNIDSTIIEYIKEMLVLLPLKQKELYYYGKKNNQY